MYVPWTIFLYDLQLRFVRFFARLPGLVPLWDCKIGAVSKDRTTASYSKPISKAYDRTHISGILNIVQIDDFVIHFYSGDGCIWDWKYDKISDSLLPNCEI